MSKTNVTILGAGNWGTVLAILASKNNNAVTLYDHNTKRADDIQKTRKNSQYLPNIELPSSVTVTSNLNQCFQSQLIVPVVPAKNFRSLLKQISPFIRADHFIVHGIKGLEPETHLRMSQVILEETAALRIGMLSGPNLALELAAGQIGATVVASRFEEVIETMQTTFGSSQFRIYGNHDLVGVEWAGALKNILAIACGILTELGFGLNAQAMLLTRAIAEMSRLISCMEADTNTLLGLSGIGDIIATCFSTKSRNFQAGTMLARGEAKGSIEAKLQMTAEGLNTIAVAKDLSKKHKLSLPIVEGLYEIVYRNQPLKDVMKNLMQRPQTFEGA